MRCGGCGVEALALKTVICRADRDRRGTLCDECYGPLAGRLWIIPGPLNVAARCDRCGHWYNPREMAEMRMGGKWSAYSGTCVDCAGDG